MTEGVTSAQAHFTLQPETLPPYQRPHPRGGCLRSRLGEFRQIPPQSLRDSSPRGSKPSQALPRQLSRRESQAVTFVAKVLGLMGKFPVVLLPLPLGEVASPEAMTEGVTSAQAHFALQPETFPPCQGLPLRGSWHRVAMTERVCRPLGQDGRGNFHFSTPKS